MISILELIVTLAGHANAETLVPGWSIHEKRHESTVREYQGGGEIVDHRNTSYVSYLCYNHQTVTLTSAKLSIDDTQTSLLPDSRNEERQYRDSLSGNLLSSCFVVDQDIFYQNSDKFDEKYRTDFRNGIVVVSSEVVDGAVFYTCDGKLYADAVCPRPEPAPFCPKENNATPLIYPQVGIYNGFPVLFVGDDNAPALRLYSVTGLEGLADGAYYDEISEKRVPMLTVTHSNDVAFFALPNALDGSCYYAVDCHGEVSAVARAEVSGYRFSECTAVQNYDYQLKHAGTTIANPAKGMKAAKERDVPPFYPAEPDVYPSTPHEYRVYDENPECLTALLSLPRSCYDPPVVPASRVREGPFYVDFAVPSKYVVYNTELPWHAYFDAVDCDGQRLPSDRRISLYRGEY